jgi:hypothetical protein
VSQPYAYGEGVLDGPHVPRPLPPAGLSEKYAAVGTAPLSAGFFYGGFTASNSPLARNPSAPVTFVTGRLPRVGVAIAAGARELTGIGNDPL